MDEDCKHVFKIIIIGDSGVGKSSILQRFSNNQFPLNHITTIGVDFKRRTLLINGEQVKLTIWDTAGHERFRTITKTYYRGADGILVVYDVTDLSSFVNITKWLHEIEQNCNMVTRILVGNKIDINNKRRIMTEEAKLYADNLGIEYFETSAKSNTNIEALFLTLTKQIIKAKEEYKEIQKIKSSIIQLQNTKRRSRNLGDLCC